MTRIEKDLLDAQLDTRYFTAINMILENCKNQKVWEKAKELQKVMRDEALGAYTNAR